MKKNLAIVIPAYKIDFFRATLDSLATQTCKDFTVYIGDDCSSADFRSLVDEYSSQLDIVYKRFDTNLGGKDLVGQWERCIGMTKGEPWIWLFSDDDMMGGRCVELFYKILDHNNDYDIFHYNVCVIDEKNNIIKKVRPFPTRITSVDFYKQKETDRLDSFVVEYVFKRSTFEWLGGFQKFKMAWGSDTTTWMKLGSRKAIVTIVGDYVFWRKSSVNITPMKSKCLVREKLLTNIDKYNWVNTFVKNNAIKRFNVYILFRMIFFYSKIIDKEVVKEVLGKAIRYNIIDKYVAFTIDACFPFIRLLKKIKDILYETKDTVYHSICTSSCSSRGKEYDDYAQ